MRKTSLKSSMKIPWRRTLLAVCLIAAVCLPSLVEGADEKTVEKGDDKKEDEKFLPSVDEATKKDEKVDDKKADEKKEEKADDKKADEKTDEKADDKKDEKPADKKDEKADDKKDDEKKEEEFDEFGDPKKPGAESSIFGGATPAEGDSGPPQIPKAVQSCNGIYINYIFMGREKIYPHTKNTTAQAWAFKAQVELVNMGVTELKSWKLFIGFHHKELLVSVEGAVVEGEDLPAEVGDNGTTISGYPQADLKTAIQTAGDFNQMATKVNIKGTMFGVKPPRTPMPKGIKLENEGFKCPSTGCS